MPRECLCNGPVLGIPHQNTRVVTGRCNPLTVRTPGHRIQWTMMLVPTSQFLTIANDRMAALNDAYAVIEKARAAA